MDFDGFVISANTKDIIGDLQILTDLFDFSNLNNNHELLSNKNESVLGRFKIQTPIKNIWIEEYISLKSRAYSIKGNKKITDKLKGISIPQVKNYQV